jgi:hypothetical protein
VDIMKIRTSSFYEIIKVRIYVEDGPIRPMQYSKTGARYRVETVVLDWKRTTDLDWVLFSVSLHGHKQLKNGGDSTMAHSENIPRYRDQGTAWPSWLREIVKLHRPEAKGSCAGTVIEMEIRDDG